jgi:alpha-mannosidase
MLARVSVNVPLEMIPPSGYTALNVAPDPVKKIEFGSLVTGHQTLENEYLRVVINDSGSLDIEDKRTGKTWRNLLVFEDGGDNGDGYNYSPPRFDQVYGSGSATCSVALVSNGPVSAAFEIRHSWELPSGLDESRQRRSRETAPLRMTTRVELGQYDEVIRCRTVLHNTHRNHRLRVLFPAGIETNECFADGQFDLLRRPVRIPQPPRDVWIEDQPSILCRLSADCPMAGRDSPSSFMASTSSRSSTGRTGRSP